MAKWKEVQLPELALRLRWAAVMTVPASLATGWLAGEVRPVASLGFMMAYWILASVATDLWERIRPNGRPWRILFQKLRQIPRALVGMMVAHLGVAAFCFGVVMVKTYEVERDVQMNVGDTTTVNGYTFTFKGVRELKGPNYQAVQGQMDVMRSGKLVSQLHPEKRVYRVQQNPMTEADIDAGVTRDLYVSLGEPVESGAWIVRVYVKPFINWIWGGCLLMALGGLLAVSDRRYRSKSGAQNS